jgi:uncharacterized Rossmann fold enzyme
MENISLDESATINVAGTETSAKDILCQNKEVVFTALEAVKALVKNPILKLVVGTVVTLIENIVTKICA